MSPKAQELAKLIEKLPKKQQTLIFELVITLLPDDSDILTSEDLADNGQARLEYSRGECVDLDDLIANGRDEIASELVKRLVLAWDPDFTKLTPAEAMELEEAQAEYERGEFIWEDI